MSSSKVKCTCGWSWNKSDSSKKDMYICHECGRDNSNNMKNGGWLDNYADGGTMQEHQENYNDYKVSAPKGMVGDGFSNVGRNYSPAWGGQFQKGGYIKKKVNKTEKDLLKKYIDPVEERAFKRAKQQGINTGIHNGPLDAIRHSSSAAAMSSALPTWTNFIPGVAPLKIAATNAAGIAHEIGSPNSWKEHASDVYNNFIGSVVGALPISEKNQHDLLIKAQKYGVLSDMGDKTPLRKRPAAPQLAVPKLPPFQMGGSIPGAVGFSYARTNSPAPSNGKYAKKTMASAQNGTVKESTSVNRDRRIPSVKDVIKKVPGTKVYKDVYGNLLEKDDKGVYKPRQKEKEEVRKHVPQSKLSKAKEIALNPMTAAGYKVRNEDIPENFSRSEDTRNNLDTAVDFINPAWYAESAKNLVQNQGQVFSDVSEGNFQDAGINQLMAGVEALNFIPLAKGAKPLLNKGMQQLGNIKTSVAPELRQGLRTNGLTFNGTPRKYPINNSQRAVTEDIDRLFKEFPELAKIGSKEDYIKHLETIHPETTQPGIFYRGSKNPNLNASEWTPNPGGGNNLGQGFYFTPDPFKSEKYGPEMKALLDIKDPTYTSLRLNSNNGFIVPNGMMTKDLVEEGSGILSVQNPNRDLFTEMGSRAEGYMHKYKGPLDEQGFPVATRPYTSSPHYIEYSQIDEVAVPNNSQIHVLGSDADKELFKNYLNNNKKRDGGIIKDDRGQWDHPGEITEIGSNQITMQGVPYPVLGVSDEGDVQMMYPEEEYKFKGKKVTEFPMAKNGIRQEQKGLVNLDQLTNFTNYNKPTVGGWLDKY